MKLLPLFFSIIVSLTGCGQKNEKPFMSRNDFIGTWEFKANKPKTPISLMQATGYRLVFAFKPDGNVILVNSTVPSSNPFYTWKIEGKYLNLNWKQKGIISFDNKLAFVKKENDCLIFKPVLLTGIRFKRILYKACRVNNKN